MGDMGEIFREMRQEKKRRKEERLAAANSEGWTKHTSYHWSREVDGNRLDYWPSTGRCRYKGRNRNINSNFIKALLTPAEVEA